MLWDGRDINVLWGYSPVTTPAIKWHRVSNGNWKGSDRTVAEDVYEARVIFKGDKSDLEDLETTLDNNRTDFTCVCGPGEEIFGAEIDYSLTLPVTVLNYGRIRQGSFKGYEMELTLRHLNPDFQTVTPDFSKLRLSSHQNTRESEFDITKNFTYDGVGFAADHLTDPGIFEGQFTQTIKEMPAIRRYLLTTARANVIPFPTFGGITEPFGTRMGTGPFNCKVIRWSDGGRPNFQEWTLNMTFAREF